MKQDKTAREVVDPLTQGEMQWSGLDCRVLGTFYDDVVGTTPMIAWAPTWTISTQPPGTSFTALARGDVVHRLLPHLTAGDIEADAEPHRIRIGSVRYSSNASQGATLRKPRCTGVRQGRGLRLDEDGCVRHD